MEAEITSAGPWEDFKQAGADSPPWADFKPSTPSPEEERRAAKGRALRGEQMAERRSGYGADAFMAGADALGYVGDALSKADPLTIVPRLAWSLNQMGKPPEQQQAFPLDSKTPLLGSEPWTPELAGDMMRAVGLPGATDVQNQAQAAGIINAAADFGRFFTTPEGLEVMASGKFGPELAKRALAMGFTAQMANEVPEAIGQAAQLAYDPNAKTEDKTRAALGAAANVVLPASIIGAHAKFPRVPTPGETAGKMLADTVDNPAVARQLEEIAQQQALEATLPRTLDSRLSTLDRPAGMVTTEGRPWEDFKPAESSKVEPAPEQLNEATPSVNSPAVRGEAAMETRPAAGWTPDGPREPAVSPDLAETIQALREGYVPKVEAQSETSNVQRSTSIPDLPTFVAQAIAKEMAPDVNVELVRRRFGAAEAANAKSSKPTATEAELIAKAKARAEQQGWDWSEVLSKVQQQLGLDADFLPKGGNDAIQLAAMRKQDALAADRAKRFDASLADSPNRPDQSGRPTELTPPAKAMEQGFKNIAARQEEAHRRFVSDAEEQFGVTPEQARAALNFYKQRKWAKLDSVNGRFDLKAGNLWEAEAIREAARQGEPKPAAQPGVAPTGAEPPAQPGGEQSTLAQSAADAKPKKVRVGKSLASRLTDETQRVGDDIISFIHESGGMLSKAAAKAQGKDRWSLIAPEYDDARPLALPWHNLIYRGMRTPDKVAQAAFEAGKLSEPSVPELWQAISDASRRRRSSAGTASREERFIQEEAAAHERWAKATATGKFTVTNEQLGVGDVLDVDGVKVEVTARDPETGRLTLQDGREFETQFLEDGQSIHVESWVEKTPQGEKVVDDWDQPEAAPEPAEPKIEAVPENRQTEAAVAAQLAPAMRDLNGRPTGWSFSRNSEGGTLVSPDGKQMVKFWSGNPRSGADAQRQFALAQMWAIENPLRLETPKGELVVKPVFDQTTPRKLTKAEGAEYSELEDKRRAAQEGGAPLTLEEAKRYQELTALAGQQELLAESGASSTAGRVATLQAKLAEVERLEGMARKRLYESKAGSNAREMTMQEVRGYSDAAAQLRAEIDQIQNGPKVVQAEPDLFGGNPDINSGALGQFGMGGAKPSEYALGQHTATGIKNATVDAERVRRGLPPAMEAGHRAWEGVWDEAMAKVDADPEVQDQLIASLKANPRAVTDLEDALLLHRQVDLQNEYAKATRELAQAYEDSKTFPNRAEAVAELKVRTAELSDRLLELYDVNKAVGTETGRGLAARKMMAYEDFSLAKMEMEKRAAKGGAPLTDAERAEMVKLQQRIEQTQAAYDDYRAKVEQERANRMTDEAIADMKRELASRPNYDSRIVKIAEEIVTKLEKQAAKSDAAIREMLSRASSGLDPTLVYHLGVKGAAMIARKGLDFAKFSLEMADAYGEKVKPYLQAAWERANLHLENEGAKYGDKAAPVKRLLRKRDAAGQREGIIEGLQKAKAEGVPLNLAGDYIRKLALSFVRGGITEREALVDAVHKVVTEDVGMDLTRRETMDAISGYGSFKPLDREAAKVLLRDLKGQMQQVAKLEDITAKKPLQKSGVERREQSDEERRLIQQVNEAKRRFGVVVTDPARQLKSALDAVKTRLKNQISDLEYQISTKERIVKSKTDAPFDAETKLMEVRRDELRRQLDELVPKPGRTDEQLLAASMRAVERTIADYEQRIAAGDVAVKKAKPTITSAELEALKARRDAVRAEWQELRALSPEFQASQAARSLAALKTRLTRQAADYADRVASKDYAPRVRKPVILDAEASRLKAIAERAKGEWRKAVALDRMANRSTAEKVMDAAVAWNRFAILSSPTVFMKLGMAAAWRMSTAPLLEGIGSGISKVLPGLAERAPRHGTGLNLRTEIKALTEGIVAGMGDAAKMMHTGETDLDVLYGKFRDAAGIGESSKLPPTWLDFWGHLHGAIKTVPKRAEFTRSLEKNLAWEATQGADVTQPGVQMRAALRAYKDAERAIFMQDNRVVGAYKSALRWLEQKEKATGETPLRWKIAGTGARLALPIVKVPTNIAAEIFEHVFGLVTGAKGAAKAYAKGLEKVGPEEADAVLRQLKNGSLGNAVLLLGFYTGAQYLGGMHVHDEKRAKTDIKPSAARVPGVEVAPWLGGPDIPKNALHFPLISVAQMGATAARVTGTKLHKKDAEPQGIGAGAIAAALGLAEEVPFMREGAMVADLRAPHAVERYVGDKARSILIPQLVQWTARQLDSGDDWNVARREPKTAADHLKLGIPLMRNSVPEKVEKRTR